MVKRRDGDDSAFPVNGTQSKRKQRGQSSTIGEANPNSRAAQWLREAAKKPPLKKQEINNTSVTNDINVESNEGEAETTVGQLLDLVFDEIFEYVGRLENTMLEMYREAQVIKEKVDGFGDNADALIQLEREFRALQSIVLSLQTTRQFNLIPDRYQPITDPNVVIPTITSDNTNPDSIRMTTDQMDKE